jgi:hypothetical protein
MVQWQVVGQTGELGPLSFLPDASFRFAGMNFDMDCSFENVCLGDARFDKKPGRAEVLRITARDAIHFIRFDEGQWYYARVGRRPFAKLLLAAIAILVLVGLYAMSR